GGVGAAGVRPAAAAVAAVAGIGRAPSPANHAISGACATRAGGSAIAADATDAAAAGIRLVAGEGAVNHAHVIAVVEERAAGGIAACTAVAAVAGTGGGAGRPGAARADGSRRTGSRGPAKSARAARAALGFVARN